MGADGPWSAGTAGSFTGGVAAAPATIERANASDRAFLAMDTGGVPEQFGVLLRLQGADLDLPAVRRLLADRIPALPRLRQRLERVPPGCGGPVWVDDPTFDVRHHVHEVPCRPPYDDQALLDTALGVVMARLTRHRPLWDVTLLTRASGPAVVVVLHHALADGIAGLAVLAGLVDEGARPVSPPFPRPRPTPLSLARDAMRARVRGVRSAAGTLQVLRTSMAAGGGLHPERAADCSLQQVTGSRRRVAVARTPLGPLRSSAHAVGATTNDAVLVAVVRALAAVLRARGEHVDVLVSAVPVSGRPGADAAELGNMVSPLIVAAPTSGDLEQALREVSATVREHKAQATGPPPIALLGWAFRPMTRLGGYRWYMNHQHRMHTLVSHLRGPDEPLHLGGHVITDAVPLAVSECGNMPTYFEVLSYAGTLTVSVVVDPDHFAELDLLASSLAAELEAVADLRPSAV